MDALMEKYIQQIKKTLTQKSSTTQSTETSNSDIYSAEFTNLKSLNNILKESQNTMFSNQELNQDILINNLRTMKDNLITNLSHSKTEECNFKEKLNEIKVQNDLFKHSFKFLTDEIEQLKNLNFIVENKISEYDFNINKIEHEINHTKLMIYFIQNEDFEKIYPHNIKEDIIIETMKNDLKTMKKKMIILSHEQKANKKRISSLLDKLKKINKQRQKSMYKISEMVEEDDNEDEILEQTKNERLSDRESNLRRENYCLYKDKQARTKNNEGKGLTDRESRHKKSKFGYTL